MEQKQRFWFVCFLEQTHKPLALFAVKSKANWSSTVRFALLTGAVTTVSKPEQRFCFVCSDYLLARNHKVNPARIGPHLNTCHRATRMKPCLSEGAWPTLGSIPSSDVHTSISEFATAHRKHQLPSSTSKQSPHYYTQSNTTADRRSIHKPAHTFNPIPGSKPRLVS